MMGYICPVSARAWEYGVCIAFGTVVGYVASKIRDRLRRNQEVRDSLMGLISFATVIGGAAAYVEDASRRRQDRRIAAFHNLSAPGNQQKPTAVFAQHNNK
jgi:hypothetical protein